MRLVTPMKSNGTVKRFVTEEQRLLSNISSEASALSDIAKLKEGSTEEEIIQQLLDANKKMLKLNTWLGESRFLMFQRMMTHR